MSATAARGMACSLLLALASQSAQPPGWQWRETPDFLQNRGGFGLAYDPGRERAVLFGGNFFSRRPQADTWEWDGSRWTQVHPRVSPPARYTPSMAYDPIRGTVLLFGGMDSSLTPPRFFDDTWEWDGRTWRQIQACPRPQARRGAAMATDPVRKRVVLFGGATRAGGFNGGNGEVNDTWEWDGTAWIERKPATVPGRRNGGRMAFCGRTGAMLLFGGGIFSGPSPPTGTWAWDGNDWTKLAPNDEPPLRSEHGMATDPLNGSVVVYGGFANGSGGSFDDTWVWDGSDWTEVVTPNDPPLRGAPQLVSVDHRGEILQFGAAEYPGYLPWLVRTWARKAGVWRVAERRDRPGRLRALVYDDARQQAVVLAGQWQIEVWTLQGASFTKQATAPLNMPWISSGAVYHGGLRQVVLMANGLWAWDGSTWSQLPAGSSSPPTSIQPMVAYDSGRDRLVRFTFDAFRAPETWEWEITGGWVRRSLAVQPPARSRGVLVYDPVLGRTVLFGGDTPGSRRKDTWEYDGTTWRQASPATAPSEQIQHGEYVPGLGGVVIWGGDRIYRWDGSDWERLAIPMVPGEPPGNPRIAFYDVAHQRLRSVSGTMGADWALYDLYDQTLTVDQRYPRPGETSRLTLTVPGEAGRPWVLGLALADRPGIPLRRLPGVGTEVLPLQDDPLLRTSLAIPLSGVLDPSGVGSWTLAVPAHPWLIGFDVHAAGVTLQPAGFGTITNGLRLTIVR